MAIFTLACKGCRKEWDVVTTVQVDARCQVCGGVGERVERVYMPQMNLNCKSDPTRIDAGEVELAMKNKAWLETPAMQAKIRSGEVHVNEGEAKWALPKLDKVNH